MSSMNFLSSMDFLSSMFFYEFYELYELYEQSPVRKKLFRYKTGSRLGPGRERSFGKELLPYGGTFFGLPGILEIVKDRIDDSADFLCRDDTALQQVRRLGGAVEIIEHSLFAKLLGTFPVHHHIGVRHSVGAQTYPGIKAVLNRTEIDAFFRCRDHMDSAVPGHG